MKYQSMEDIMNAVPEKENEYNDEYNEVKNQTVKKEVVRGVKFALFSASAGVIEITAFSLLNELTNLRYWLCYLSSGHVRTVEFHLKPQIHISLCRQCILRHAENLRLLLRVHSGIDAPGKPPGRHIALERVSGYNNYHVVKFRPRIPVRPLLRIPKYN